MNAAAIPATKKLKADPIIPIASLPLWLMPDSVFFVDAASSSSLLSFSSDGVGDVVSPSPSPSPS
eukprot:CAMPEP_0204873590 /NCGR_PEP_ID=MMETSP1348-20121228/41063_1 /ASSEMBLY_ACC=CAM_ASM_000700 /TAXON_ID=215587 /ORGANISM="Aplanochytrium stocchinoi, Strain GSBS06" /LENGTH=64 /DNA_ID=CAMNT_0052029011 /DNA_START=39 /DNA_END=229 /DNA_ORIENTATION=+